jgi:hypothetical protein
MYVSPNCIYYCYLVIVLLSLLLIFSIPSIAQTAPGAPAAKKFLHFDGGYIGYNADYRGSIDTPYAEKKILQHSINASLNLTVAGNLPFTANAWIRRSNSAFFQDINDVQVNFNAAQYRNNMINAMKKKWLDLAGNAADSQVIKAYQQKRAELEGLKGKLQNPLTLQKLLEAYEILRVPEKSHDVGAPDSVNKKKVDSMQRKAKEYVELYNKTKETYNAVAGKEDSLRSLYEGVTRRQRQFKDLIAGGGQGHSWQEMEEALRQRGGSDTGMAEKYKWLMGIRSFSLGKGAANYSELTAKNTNINGVNFVYNSWYYFAVSAGLIDYRFRDLGAPGLKAPKQYMYMVRAGLGRLEKSYVIFSYYQGRKQLFTTADSNGRVSTAIVSGVSVEMKWQLNRWVSMTTEAAQSLSPDYRYNPPAKRSGFNFTDKTNKAYAAGMQAYIPGTATRLEATYKYTGANFQSFSSYQPNSEWKSWSARVEQPFFRKTLKVTASLKSNDFSNPYLVQDYKGNTVFKTLQATWHPRKMPSLTLGYVPISQYSKVDNQVVEHRFQTLTANISHYYKMGFIRLSTLAVLNKFYNNGTDTSFLFYNATNLLIDQRVYFRDFTVGVSYSESISPSYSLKVAGEEVSFSIGTIGSIGLGARINNLNAQQTCISKFFNLNFRISQGDYISVNAEHGFLPSGAGKLVSNDFGNIQFIKRIK